MQDHLGDLLAVLDDAHLVARLAVQLDQVLGVAHRHDAHAVRARIGLHDCERLFRDAVLGVFARHALEQRRDIRREALLALPVLEIDRAAHAEVGIEQPRIDIEQRAEFERDVRVRSEMLRLPAVVPTGSEGRRDRLVDVAEHVGNARGQIVVQ